MLSGFLSLSLLPLAFGLPTSLDPAPVARQQVCNGHAELCDRKYGEVVYIGAHNSYAYGQGEFAKIWKQASGNVVKS